MPNVKSLPLVMILLLVLPLVQVVASQAHGGRKVVNCDRGQNLANAIRRARPGDKIVVSGVCNERLTIKKPLTIDGRGSAVIDGTGVSEAGSPIVAVEGSRGVALDGLTIENGAGHGVFGSDGAFFTIKNSTVRLNAQFGVAVGGLSKASLVDSSIDDNSTGLFVFNNSLVVLEGEISFSRNSGFGTNVFGRSTVELRGANVQANDNGGIGMAVANGQFLIYGFSGALENSITATGNTMGLGIGNSTFDISSQTSIVLENNSVAGLFCPEGGKLKSVSTRPSFVFKNNGIGILFERDCSLAMFGPTVNIEGNGIGILADAAGTLHFAINPSNGSSITGNGTDIDLRFGTRATLGGIPIGSIACDSTVLVRGDTVCP